jgi:hypothetical protein
MQSEGYTCGPAAAATLLRECGIETSEQEASRGMDLSSRGSTPWMLMRHLRRNGLVPRLVWCAHQPVDPPVPSVAAVQLMDSERRPGIRHFIVLLGKTDKTFIIGDPLGGRFEWDKQMTYDNYYFGGLLIHVKKPTDGE